MGHFHVFQFPTNWGLREHYFGVCAVDLESGVISFSGLYSLSTTRKTSGVYYE